MRVKPCTYTYVYVYTFSMFDFIPSCQKNLKQKKAHIMEIQVNGGNAAAKADFGYKCAA